MIPAGWRKVEWSQEAEAILGPVLADADEIAEGIERGSVELFEVGGDGYGGMLAVEMRRRIDGALVCWVHAYVGRGIMYGLADMENWLRMPGRLRLFIRRQSRRCGGCMSRLGGNVRTDFSRGD